MGQLKQGKGSAFLIFAQFMDFFVQVEIDFRRLMA